MKGQVRISQRGGTDRDDTTTSVTISGIPKDQRERVEGAIRGQFWMTVNDGEIIFSPAREALPSPVEDAEMLPFWRRREERQMVMKEMIFDHEDRHDSPSFMVKHLCGYHYTPEDYTKNAQLLESYGFVCMRSQREDDGMYWETWYLPGAWASKGDLKDAVDEHRQKMKDETSFARLVKSETKKVISFICEKVSFGSLDVTSQRAAMMIND